DCVSGMWRSLLATLFCCSMFPGPAGAQEGSAGLTGRVTDPAGGAVIGAPVTATDQDRGTALPAGTNDDGIYAFPRIPNGSYRIRVEAPGFKSYVYPDVTLEINQRGRVDVVLQLGAVSESVEVAGETALLQTEVTQVGVVLGSRTLDDA